MYSPEANINKYEEVRALFLDQIRKIELGYFEDEIIEFVNSIKEKYSRDEYGHCLLWHLIIGSTPNQTDVNFDTPGGEIEDFIRNQLPRIAEKKE